MAILKRRTSGDSKRSFHRKHPLPHHRKGKARGKGAHGRPKYNQAAKIIAKFDGEAALARILGISRVTPYRWQYAPPGGTDGLIPSHWVDAINKAARIYGVLLTELDWAPERIRYEDVPAEPGRTPYAKPNPPQE